MRIIRRAEQYDYPAILELLLHVRGVDYAGVGATFQFSGKHLSEVVETADAFWVAEENTVFAGCVGLKRGQTNVVFSLAVVPDYRRRGIGAALVQKAEEAADGPVAIALPTQHEDAIRLFANSGYSRVGVILEKQNDPQVT